MRMESFDKKGLKGKEINRINSREVERIQRELAMEELMRTWSKLQEETFGSKK